MQLSVSNRRAVMNMSMLEQAFRDELRRDSRAALKRATGKDVHADAKVELLEEDEKNWAFVVPSEGSIEDDLPPATDARAAVENDVYALLRAEPAIRTRLESDPKTFLKERFEIDLGDAGVNLRSETKDELVLVLPFVTGREELPDELLDLVAGGGDPGCQNGNNPNQRTTPKPWG